MRFRGTSDRWIEERVIRLVEFDKLGSPSDWLGLNQRIPKKSGSVRVVFVTDDQGVMGFDSAQHSISPETIVQTCTKVEAAVSLE
ncbi:MAG: hypothetical protein ACI8T1_002678 [Verrucomicrobiales bacterium]|jgi:hypothetical protein